ncbi:hypothetical protein D3C73_1247960 [compost metagenome]
MSHLRRHVDDGARQAFLEQAARHRAAGVERRLDVQVQHRVDVLVGLLHQGLGAIHAGVVHQDVEGVGLRHRMVHGGGVRHVQHQRRAADAFGAQGFTDLQQFGLAARRHRDVRTGAPQRGGGRQANAAAAARHQGTASVQTEVGSFGQRNHACASTG